MATRDWDTGRAAEIARLCAAAGEGGAAAELIKYGTSIADAPAELARRRAVREAVTEAAAGNLAVDPALADRFIEEGLDADAACARLAAVGTIRPPAPEQVGAAADPHGWGAALARIAADEPAWFTSDARRMGR